MINYDELDPNIRKLVKYLNDKGYTTCDSGDGKYKFEVLGWSKDDCALNIPHVFMQCDPLNMYDMVVSLESDLASLGIYLGEPKSLEEAYKMPTVSVSYNPSHEHAILEVLNVADSDIDWDCLPHYDFSKATKREVLKELTQLSEEIAAEAGSCYSHFPEECDCAK